MPIFNTWAQGQRLGGEQARNMLAQIPALEQRQRQEQLRNVLSQAYQPAQPAAAPELQVGPVQPGQEMPYPATQGGLSMQDAINAMYQGGLGPEALKLQSSMMTATGQAPSAVKEYQFFSQLGPEQQNAFMGLKRQGYQVKDIAGVPTLVSMIPGVPNIPLSSLAGETSAAAAESAAKKEAEIAAKTKAEAGAQLPMAELGAEKTISKIDDLLKMPGLEDAFGMKSYLPTVRGSDRANFEAKLEQLKSTVFIDNRAKLKGGGSITDFEGQKAADAEIAMSQAQSADQFKNALEEYKYWVAKGLEKLREQAGKKKETKSAGQYRVGQIVTGPDGNKYIVRTLKADGTPDDVERAK